MAMRPTEGPTEWRARVVLVICAVLLALAIAEISLRLFFKTDVDDGTASGRYFSRYLIDGRPAAKLDYYVGDPVLPFGLKAGYHHSLTDLAWHPVPFTVTLDGDGYRNQARLHRAYDLVVVGDSVAFGFGVSDTETIAARLGAWLDTYNLAIPGAGPEMYMVMLDRFLRRATTRQIAVLFYEGNDYQNLRDAFWSELATCSQPARSRILRTDSPFLPVEPSSPLYLLRLAEAARARRSAADAGDACQRLATYNSIVAAAIDDLDNWTNHAQRLAANSEKALFYADQLKAASCVGTAARQAIDQWASAIRRGETAQLGARMRAITVALAAQNCYPMGAEFGGSGAARNLTAYTNLAGFYDDYLSALSDGYDGNLLNLQTLLGRLKAAPDLAGDTGLIERLSGLVARRGTLDAIREASTTLKNVLAQRATGCQSPVSCDKENLFFDYLASLANRGVRVTLVGVPNEAALTGSPVNPSGVCPKVSRKGLTCIEAFPQLSGHYRTQRNGLYLDGSHFTVDGSARMAAWIAEGLGLKPATSAARAR